MADSIVLTTISADDNDNGRPMRADAVANRERLLATAKALFAAEGVADVHMDRIAREASVGKGTLYRHFASKGELCLALLDERFRGFQNEVLAHLLAATSAGQAYLPLLAEFLALYVGFLDEGHLELMAEVQREGVPGLNEAGPYMWLNMTVQGLLRSARQAGEVPASLDIPVWADLLLGPLTAPFFYFMRHRKGFSAARIGESLQELVEALGKMPAE